MYDTVYAFRAVPFGWAYSLVICQEILTGIVCRASVCEVIVLICCDDILVLAFRAARVQPAADAIVKL